MIQDLQIAGRVLHFQEGRASGTVDIAIVYSMADPSSQKEASGLAELMGKGLLVGDILLRPHLIEQANLAGAPRFDALFTASGVDGNLIMASLRKHRIPCLTRHLEQIENAVCTVSISSSPTVNIVVSSRNAAAVGVRFATAFRMMVREI